MAKFLHNSCAMLVGSCYCIVLYFIANGRTPLTPSLGGDPLRVC